MLSPLAALVRRHDPDRYFATLFAPAAARETLFTLYAFNHELARAPEVAREPALALIRLQWWREVVEGEAKGHEVAQPLHAAIGAGRLPRDELLAMIDAREREVAADFADVPAWTGWLMQGPGSLAVAAGRVLGAPAAALPRLRVLGAGYGAAGVLRNAPVVARQGRCLVPADLLRAFGVSAASPVASEGAVGARHILAFVGRALLGNPARCGRGWIAAALPAVLGRRDLARFPETRVRLVDDRMAVASAALRGRA